MNSKNERRVSLLEGPEPGPVVPLDTWDASHRLGCQCRHLLGTRHRATRFSLDDATTQCGGWTWLPSLLRGRGTEQVPAQPTQQSRSWDLKQAIGGYFILIGPSRSRAARLDQSARPGGQKTRASEERGASAREEPGGPPPNRVTPLSPPEAQQRRPSSKKNPLLSLEPPWCPGFGWCLAHSLAPTNGSLRALRLLCSFPPWSPHTGPRRQEARECQTTSVSPDTIRACGERPSGHKCRDA